MTSWNDVFELEHVCVIIIIINIIIISFKVVHWRDTLPLQVKRGLAGVHVPTETSRSRDNVFIPATRGLAHVSAYGEPARKRLTAFPWPTWAYHESVTLKSQSELDSVWIPRDCHACPRRPSTPSPCLPARPARLPTQAVSQSHRSPGFRVRFSCVGAGRAGPNETDAKRF